MKSIRFIVPTLIAAASLSTACASVRTEARLPAATGDLDAAQLIEVRGPNGDVVLHGTLKTSKNEPAGTERKAELVSPTGQKAKGEAEIEIERKDGVVKKDEIEVELERMPSMLQFELFVDGKHIMSFVTTKDGKAELKLDRTFPNVR